MRVFDELCPQPPDWRLDWAAVRESFDWVRALEGVAQDPVHHGEGDVATHTRLAVGALTGLAEWRDRPAAQRTRLFAAVLLHDVAKPWRTQVAPSGAVTAHGHSRHGDLAARRILWGLGAPPAWREHVAALVRHHQVPFWALERADLERVVLRVSLVARADDLALLATADIMGRVCTDLDEVLANIDLFEEYCAELSVLDAPWPFASDHARVTYFRTPGRDPGYAAFDDTVATITILCGLPGVGKDTWIARHAASTPVVSLDALRHELRVDPRADQGPVVAAAHERARAHLRAGRSFVWNATNLSHQQREPILALAANYRARVEIVALEAPEATIRHRNRARPAPVPDAVIDRLIRRWEAPDLTEAHVVTVVATG